MISVVVLFIAAFNLDLCGLCCNVYQCSAFNTSSKCLAGTVADGGGASCFWDAGTNSCRTEACSDMAQINCGGSSCKWNNAACVAVSSCSDWNGDSNCDNKAYDGIPCITDGSNCRATTCADLGSTSDTVCEGSMGLSCVWNPTTQNCAPATSCSAWSNTENIGRCNWKLNGECVSINGVCQTFTCPALSSSQNDCENRQCKYSSGSCSEVTSCSGWTGTTQWQCEMNRYNGTICVWDNNACRSALCSDYNTDEDECRNGGFGFANFCKWENNNCVHVDTMCGMNTQSNCENYAYCTYHEDSCPSPPGDAASWVFVPSAVMMLAALLALVFW